ncbi:hypothetical protein JRO89_XS13G0264900 [Xanthoceras sorbifolium]|uniref:Uncharacterized protein n=1 Tax=Xanthoceras sorbifolium TaxID=99658 RepID=A0ABQ8HA28_9ROSI|nr:hypothetical protein JRO89_XS13G0264900 [Xanthoceras sorbifolium]
MANILSGRPQGSLPSNTKINLRKQVKAITLRSEKPIKMVMDLDIEKQNIQDDLMKAAENLVADVVPSLKPPSTAADATIEQPTDNANSASGFATKKSENIQD